MKLMEYRKDVFEVQYRVSHQVSDLGWVDLCLRSSFGWWAASVATYCQAGWWNIPNPSQPNPGLRPADSPCTLL